MSGHVEITFEGDSAAGGPWTVNDVSLAEGVGRPYSLRAHLVTDSSDAAPAELLGKSATVTLERGDTVRRVPGIVTNVVERTAHESFVNGSIEIVLEPALSTLRHRVDTRIFQDKTVPEILAEVLGEALGGYGRSVEDRLTRACPSCEYRVQYDESDLAFCQRLMEEEGITYFFSFEGEAELMVLADPKSARDPIESSSGESLIELLTRSEDQLGREHVRHLHARSAIVPTKLVMRHFDWTHPSAPVEAESSETTDVGLPSGAAVDPEREVYEHDERPATFSEYSGSAYAKHDAKDQAVVRRQADAWRALVATGSSTVLAMQAGGELEVAGHPAPEHDGTYHVLSVRHSFEAGTYSNDFQCIPAAVPYRPRRAAAKPHIRGAQTATVVGPAGEEIHPDSYGRIKVQFHWDRLGAMDEHSSCWIRVMQPWAGAGWGFVFLPRIGMEVVVRFVDGDPDRPLVIGSVYNGTHPPPYSLPDEKTKSTIRTESSLGGGGYNELRFEDKAGSEEIFIHAQKDFNEVVENDHTTTVHHDQSIRVDNNQTQEIGNNQTEHVFANQDLTVDANRTITVHGDFTETVDGSETRTVSSGSTETIDAGETRTITGGMTETITGDRSQTIVGDSTETIVGSLTQTILGGVAIDTPATYDITAAGGVTVIAPAGITIIAPAGHTIVAPGGQTIIDGEWGKGGTDWADSIAMKFSICLLGFKTRAACWTYNGMTLEWSTFKLSKTGIDLGGWGGALEQGAIKRKAAAIAAKVAGSHVHGPG